MKMITVVILFSIMKLSFSSRDFCEPSGNIGDDLCPSGFDCARRSGSFNRGGCCPRSTQGQRPGDSYTCNTLGYMCHYSLECCNECSCCWVCAADGNGCAPVIDGGMLALGFCLLIPHIIGFAVFGYYVSQYKKDWIMMPLFIPVSSMIATIIPLAVGLGGEGNQLLGACIPILICNIILIAQTLFHRFYTMRVYMDELYKDTKEVGANVMVNVDYVNVQHVGNTVVTTTRTEPTTLHGFLKIQDIKVIGSIISFLGIYVLLSILFLAINASYAMRDPTNNDD